jgi:hypothetical protein
LFRHLAGFGEYLREQIVFLSPQQLPTPERHEAANRIYREWLRTKYGSPVGVSPDWSSMTREEAMQLTRDMFRAAEVPSAVQEAYFELFDLFLIR